MRFLPTKRECEEDTKVLCNVFMRAVRDDLGKFNSQKWCCVTRFILESIFSKEEFTTIGDVKVLRGEISQYEMRRLSHQSTGIEEISEKTALVVELFWLQILPECSWIYGWDFYLYVTWIYNNSWNFRFDLKIIN